MEDHIPPQAPDSFRVVLDLNSPQKQLDNMLLLALREQKDNIDLKNISRTDFKELFKNGQILIKGQRAKTSSSVARGLTYVDIIGYKV